MFWVRQPLYLAQSHAFDEAQTSFQHASTRKAMNRAKNRPTSPDTTDRHMLTPAPMPLSQIKANGKRKVDVGAANPVSRPTNCLDAPLVGRVHEFCVQCVNETAGSRQIHVGEPSLHVGAVILHLDQVRSGTPLLLGLILVIFSHATQE